MRSLLFLLGFLLILPYTAIQADDFAAQAECPVCKIKFATISPTIASGAQALDGRPLGHRFLPPAECPMCGGVFADETLSKGELKRVEAFIWSPEFRSARKSDAWLRHAILLEKLERNNLKIADAYLKASWASDHDKTLQKQYQEKSLELLRNYLTSSDFADEHSFAVNLKIGDLLRQLGKFAEAQKWFEKMQAQPDLKQGWRAMVIKRGLSLIAKAETSPAPFPHGNALHEAIINGDKARFSAALNDHSMINEVNMAGFSPLLLAIQEGRDAFVEALLKAGADYYQPDNLGNTPLHWSVIKQQGKLLRWLTEKSNKIDTINLAGQTPLHLAVAMANLEITLQLLEAGADLNLRDTSGNSLMHLLARSNGVAVRQIFTAIRQQISDLNPRNFADYTPVQVAAVSGNRRMIETFVEAGANINARMPDGSNVLFFCRPELIPLLLDLGASATLKNNAGHNAFVHARLNADIARITYFKRSGQYGTRAREFKIASDTFTIFSAIKMGNEEIVAQILQQDPSQIGAKDEKLGETPLHFAVAGQHSRIVALLLKQGAAINSESDFLRTPLHYAAMAGNLEIVKLLCEAQANIFALDARGSTPLHDAAAADNRKIYHYLISRGASDSTVNNDGKPASTMLENDKQTEE